MRLAPVTAPAVSPAKQPVALSVAATTTTTAARQATWTRPATTWPGVRDRRQTDAAGPRSHRDAAAEAANAPASRRPPR